MTPHRHNKASEPVKAVKTYYTVVYAEDVPHYSSTEIEAADDTHALAIAQSLDTAGLYYEGSWDSSVCKRIVSIEGPDGAAIATDIPLDNYFLRDGGQADRSLCEAASDLLELARHIHRTLSDFSPDALHALGLHVLFEKAGAAIDKATRP